VEERVGDDRENHDEKKPSDYSPNALTEAVGLRSSYRWYLKT
jgi:hypothetical protein